MKIGFFDSGLGGLTVLKEVLKNDELNEEIYYLGDTKNTPYGTKEESFVKEVIEDNINYLINIGCNPIVIACNTATSLSVKELREKYKDIVFIGTEHKYSLNEMKQKGYTRAMVDNGLEPVYYYSSGDIRVNEVFFKNMLDERVPEVALVVRDSIAISFMNCAVKRGVKVPEELQVIGFQNTKYAELSNPKLTCAEIPVYEMGNKAMSYLTELMKDDGVKVKKAEKILLAYGIVWRESTK